MKVVIRAVGKLMLVSIRAFRWSKNRPTSDLKVRYVSLEEQKHYKSIQKLIRRSMIGTRDKLTDIVFGMTTLITAEIAFISCQKFLKCYLRLYAVAYPWYYLMTRKNSGSSMYLIWWTNRHSVRILADVLQHCRSWCCCSL
jgi:hypothetical protein